ncbi:MAG: hypothetical protein QOJ73_830 [Streptosporangiaceae bacterium]|nr:hypothetical protein [Streptosporangiaceae bacterium]
MSTGSLYLWMFGGMIGLPVAVVVVSALTASRFRRRQDRLIVTTGRRAIGLVVAVGCDTADMGSTTYWVRVQYNCDGEPATAQAVVSQRDQQRYRAGQRVGLTYAPSRSQVVRLDPPEWAPHQTS